MLRSYETEPLDPSYWCESKKVTEKGIKLDIDRPFESNPEFDGAIAAMVGEKLPVIAGIRAARESAFIVLDSRLSETIHSPFLVLQDNEENGQSGSAGLWSDEEMVIGRKHLKDYFSYTSTISREHFSLFYDEEKNTLLLQDLGSANGTSVTGYVRDIGALEVSRHSKNIRANFSDLGGQALLGRSYFEKGSETSRYGYYHNHPIIGRESKTVRNGVYGTRSSEWVAVDDESMFTSAAVEAVMGNLEALNEKSPLSTQQILQTIKKETAEYLNYDLIETERISSPHYKDNSIVPLSEYLKAGAGVCRQQALLAALFIEAATDKGLLTGSISVERNHDLQIDGAHAWVVFSQDAQGDIIVDPAQDFVGTREEARRQKRWRYTVAHTEE